MEKFNEFLGKTFVILFLLSVCLNVVFIVKTNVFKPNTNRIQTEYKPVADTVIITRTDTILHTIEKQVFIDRPTLVSEDTTGTRVYMDTIRTQHVDIYTRADVEGVFKTNTFEYKLKFPEYRTTKMATITKFQEAKVYTSGFYAVGSTMIAPGTIDLFTGVAYIPNRGRMLFSYQYGLSNRAHLATVGYRF